MSGHLEEEEWLGHPLREGEISGGRRAERVGGALLAPCRRRHGDLVRWRSRMLLRGRAGGRRIQLASTAWPQSSFRSGGTGGADGARHYGLASESIIVRSMPSTASSAF
ncbi:MAG: hypothetical protein M1815_004835 [Lichina confinis]|nr:MAG: hypothetical protein M1815_004835 [Lichina confinis]